MSIWKRMLLACFALTLASLLVAVYVKAKPRVRTIALQAASPLQLKLPSGADFPGLIAVTEDYIGCNPDLGCKPPGQQRVFAEKNDGLTAEQFWNITPAGDKVNQQSIINVSGWRIFMFPATKVKTSYRIPSNDPLELKARRVNPLKDCLETMRGEFPYASDFVKFAGKAYIAATDAKVTYHSVKFHSSSETADSDIWLVPELACFEIRSEYTWKAKTAAGVHGYQKTYHVTRSVHLAPPSEDWFVVPDDFREATPSEAAYEAFASQLRPRGIEESEIKKNWKPPASLSLSDRQYAENRKKNGLK